MTNSIAPSTVKALRALMAIVVVGSGACASPSTSSSTAPTAPAAPITEMFSGSFSQLGNAAFPFTVSATGSVQVSLTAVAPLSTMALGIDIGQWDGTTSTCTIGVAANDHAKSGVTALSGTATPGTYCVQVSDSGNVPPGSMVTFTVQVIHT